ncbi:hypothetical protein H9649_16890 [Sporosarcina sp. Sa2YVA2]|uniref:Uncharacterized protein n=1 Tax=Sporosarcina quadrami TaxID=2762234 RepID=A0ABR8UF56_9BACL|nr:hypothetical protein [Sporosarcina quadrami]MBD7986249.1 hypothetical protein [Sporosarcina quadrami]
MSSKTLFDNQLEDLGEVRNAADAQYIYDVLHAHIRYADAMKESGERFTMAAVNVVDRNAMQKMWEEARIPKIRHSHNKPYDFPWSRNARELYAKGGDMARLFHLEHTLELKTIKDEAIRRMRLSEGEEEAIRSGADMLKYLEEIHYGTAFVVLTADEHSRLPKGDLAKTEDVWVFYERHGIYKEECISLREAGLVEGLA